MWNLRQPLIAALALAWCAAAQAQSYKDSAGTTVQGAVIIDPAAPAGGGTGPLGTAANPIHTTGGGGGAVTQSTGAGAAAPWSVEISNGAAFNSLTAPLFTSPATGATYPVTGTFWQTTQPVSAASLPLPTGASTAALQPALNGDGGSLAHVTNFPASQPVTTPTPSSIVTGQVIIATTGTAVQLASNALVNGIVIKSKATNNAACGAVGGSSVTNAYTGSGNGFGICPGEAPSVSVNNTNVLYVNGTAGDIFTFIGN